MKKKLTVQEVRKAAESLGFKYRAASEAGSLKEWVTFTYPDTNTYVIYIDLEKTNNIMLRLADELVRCGRILQRQAFLREFSPFNYD